MNSPCAMLITPICPKMIARPSPISSTANRLMPAKPCMRPMLSISAKVMARTPEGVGLQSRKHAQGAVLVSPKTGPRQAKRSPLVDAADRLRRSARIAPWGGCRLHAVSKQRGGLLIPFGERIGLDQIRRLRHHLERGVRQAHGDARLAPQVVVLVELHVALGCGLELDAGL